MIYTTDNAIALYPSDLGAEEYQGETLPEAVNEPQFVGFQCLGCSGRHAELLDLLDCQNRLMRFYVNQRAELVAA